MRTFAAPPKRLLIIWIGLAAAAAGLTMLFLGMRAVMEIGGACASGNHPFEITRPCPEGVALLTIGGVWLGLIGAGIYAWRSISAGIPSVTWLLWPALFISLGWNFLDYAFNPPFGDGPVWGWLIPGVLFWIMGGVPLWFGISMWRQKEYPTQLRNAMLPPKLLGLRENTVTKLSKLDSAYQAGALTVDEYERAKSRLERSQS